MLVYYQCSEDVENGGEQKMGDAGYAAHAGG